MGKTEISQEEVERVRQYIPFTVKHRQLLIREIVAELNRRGFKTLDETDYEDLDRVCVIVSDMHPESNPRTVKDYAKVAIRLWQREHAV